MLLINVALILTQTELYRTDYNITISVFCSQSNPNDRAASQWHACKVKDVSIYGDGEFILYI